MCCTMPATQVTVLPAAWFPPISSGRSFFNRWPPGLGNVWLASAQRRWFMPNRHRQRYPFLLNLVGPLTVSNGFTHLFTVIDCSSCWPEAIPLSSTITAACASALDKPLWGTLLNHLEPWCTIHCLPLGRNMPGVWYTPFSNLCLSSPGQWHC
jgi:hypothetical protein